MSQKIITLSSFGLLSTYLFSVTASVQTIGKKTNYSTKTIFLSGSNTCASTCAHAHTLHCVGRRDNIFIFIIFLVFFVYFIYFNLIFRACCHIRQTDKYLKTSHVANTEVKFISDKTESRDLQLTYFDRGLTTVCLITQRKPNKTKQTNKQKRRN